jgi:hypothetical protein
LGKRGIVTHILINFGGKIFLIQGGGRVYCRGKGNSCVAEERNMFGVRCFAVTYNIFGLAGLTAIKFGFLAAVERNSLVIVYPDIVQMLAIVITVLFFASSLFLLTRNKLGVFIPILLLSFVIAGGFWLIVPLLIGHIHYFTQTELKELFALV